MPQMQIRNTQTSWAGLFSPNNNVGNNQQKQQQPQQNEPINSKSSPKILSITSNQYKFGSDNNDKGTDERTIKYGDFLKTYTTDFQPISLRPRGLSNPSNYCFINAVLQALIGCSPLYNLLKTTSKQSAAIHLDKSKIPAINAVSKLLAVYNTLPFGAKLRNQNNKDELVCTDTAIAPSSIYQLWNSSRSYFDVGRQGDAEEFLSFLLNKLDDEMLEVINAFGNAFGDTANKDTRQTHFGRTPISDIFRGELRSHLQREGQHSTDVIQPFYTLQLNVKVRI